MTGRNIWLPAMTLLMTIAFCGIAGGGNNKTNFAQNFGQTPSTFPPQYNAGMGGNNPLPFFATISPIFQSEFDALGARMKMRGKEKTVYEGDLVNAKGKSSKVRVTFQLPGLVKLEGFKNSESVLAFDGEKVIGELSASDEALLEMFLMDMPEAVMGLTAPGSQARLLGRSFGPDPRKEPNYTGPRYDIYQVTMTVVFKKTKDMQGKTCHFDSKSGLLHKVEYQIQNDSQKVKVETRFPVWGTIDGSAYPAQIERYEDGNLIFSFAPTKIEGGPAVNASNFR
jgi:hypothetical protein